MKKILSSIVAIVLMSCVAPAHAESSLYGGANSFVNLGTGMGIYYGGGAYANAIRSSRGVGVIWYPGNNPPTNVSFNYSTGQYEPYNCCSGGH
jgi:hypothetical protein